MINNWLFSIWLFKEENLGGIYTLHSSKSFFSRKRWWLQLIFYGHTNVTYVPLVVKQKNFQYLVLQNRIHERQFLLKGLNMIFYYSKHLSFLEKK